MSYRILPGVPPAQRFDDNRERIAARPWLTAKGYRAIGVPIPEGIPDDAIVELVYEARG